MVSFLRRRRFLCSVSWCVPRYIPAGCVSVSVVSLIFLINCVPLFASDAYRIARGDTLLIAVVGQPEYTHSVAVRDDGRISYFGAELRVAGKTVGAVNGAVRDHLVESGLVSQPVVLISPVLQERGIFVGGAVKAPGRYPISPARDIGLYRAIALAGGMSEGADRQRVAVIRVAGGVENYDLSPEVPYREIRVGVDDLVYVMRLGVVEVQGEVQVPGPVFVQGTLGIGAALARVGGPTAEADLAGVVKISVTGERRVFDLSDSFWRSEESAVLSAGDVLYVPNVFQLEPIYVTGYVRVPGAQRVRGPLRVSQVVGLAGGFESSAERESGVILRRDGSSVDVVFASETLVYPGDILEVKQRFQVNWGLVSTLGYIIISGTGIILNLLN